MARSALPALRLERFGRFPAIPRRALTAVAIAVAVVTGALFWTSLKLIRGAQVARLPETERTALYGRMRADLELCAGAAGKLIKKHCEHQAELVVELPECDASCKKLASPWHKLPVH
jgi:hypothetical protein